MSADLVIGIDPGVNTGVAVYSRADNELILVKTMSFWETYRWCIGTAITSPVAEIRIEVPDTKHVWHTKPKDVKAMQRQAVNVGGAIRESQLLADGLAMAGFVVKRIHPRGKVSAKEFTRITGWDKRCSQHARDAGMLCFGR